MNQTSNTAFQLDPRLERDSVQVAESPVSQLRLFNDDRYFWVVLVPKVADAVEWFDLDDELQQALLAETLACARAIKSNPLIKKANIGALGNIVTQLHVHVIGRSPEDPAWPGPVWGHSPATPLSPERLSERVQLLKNSSLGLRFSFSAL